SRQGDACGIGSDTQAVGPGIGRLLSDGDGIKVASAAVSVVRPIVHTAPAGFLADQGFGRRISIAAYPNVGIVIRGHIEGIIASGPRDEITGITTAGVVTITAPVFERGKPADFARLG